MKFEVSYHSRREERRAAAAAATWSNMTSEPVEMREPKRAKIGSSGSLSISKSGVRLDTGFLIN